MLELYRLRIVRELLGCNPDQCRVMHVLGRHIYEMADPFIKATFTTLG